MQDIARTARDVARTSNDSQLRLRVPGRVPDKALLDHARLFLDTGKQFSAQLLELGLSAEWESGFTAALDTYEAALTGRRANAWYSVGVCRLRGGDADAARAAFEEAIARVPRHAMAHAGKTLIGRQRVTMDDGTSSVDAALAGAALRAAGGDVEGAAQLMSAALAEAPSGNALWWLPIDPLIGVKRNRTAWASVLATLCARAS